MKKKVYQQSLKEEKKSMTSSLIILIVTTISIFLESILVILSLFKKGIFKKELLSSNSNLGFDLIIKRK
tara:strand:+ start:172 stop:378 length:207 start_codon:yes stop_codon:yes gene_type:complete